MASDQQDAALKEAARVAALKRISAAKLAARAGGNYEVAAQFVDAIYSVFPPPPVSAEASTGRPSSAAEPSKAEGEPDGD